MQLLSNELKAVAVMADLSESSNGITSDQCMSLQHFDYRCVRKRDAKGHTYKAAEPVMLCFSVRVNTSAQAQPFYKQLTVNENGPISFIFNATFSDSERLTGYDDAMVVNGCMTDVQEDFHSVAFPEQNEEQMILNARMIVHSILFLTERTKKTFNVQ